MGKSAPGAFSVISGKVGGTVGYSLKNSKNKATQGWRGYQPVVKNPRTNAQLYQRAILKTISNMYATGKEIFDHSFQGKSVGAANMKEFMSRNMRALRAQLAADQLTSTLADKKARVVAPGTLIPVPNAYIISQGTYQQNFFTLNSATTEIDLPARPTSETMTASEYASLHGLVSGDLYTIVHLSVLPATQVGGVAGSQYSVQREAVFGYLRMRVRDEFGANVGSEIRLSDLFEATKSVNSTFDLSSAFVGESLGLPSFNNGNITFGALGVIRSREDSDLRSNSTMIVAYGSDTQSSYAYGVTDNFLEEVWRNAGDTLGNSELILEGGDGNF